MFTKLGRDEVLMVPYKCGGSRAGQGMKCCYFWFHSEVKFSTHFRHLFGLIVILPYFNAISVDFYAVKCLIYIYFVFFSMFMSEKEC